MAKYSVKQRIAFAFGRGSTLGTTAKGREKHVRSIFKTDEEILSYKQGRKYEQDRKKKYLSNKRKKKSASSSGNLPAINVTVYTDGAKTTSKKSVSSRLKGRKMRVNKNTGEVVTPDVE